MENSSHPSSTRRFIGLVLWSMAIYVCFLALLILIQRQLMYFPDSNAFSPQSYHLDDFQKIEYAARDGINLHGFYAPPKTANNKVIVFFQGNAGNLGLRAEKIRKWREWGYGVMLPTYRGYHGNKGAPTEEGLYLDARAGLNAMKANFKIAPEDIVLYGESLGTGIATQMAIEMAKNIPARGVILEVPYTSIPDVGAYRYPFMPISKFLQDRYESAQKIPRIKTQLLILRAGHDSVVPPIFAKKLFDAAVQPKEMVTSPNADHMEIYKDESAVAALKIFLDKL